MTLYDILGVPKTATQEEIRSAYMAQIKFFHPDVFSGSEDVARIKTQQLNEAYATLKDAGKRALYDYALAREEADREVRSKTANEDENNTCKTGYQRVHYEPKQNVSSKKKINWSYRSAKILISLLLIFMAVLSNLTSDKSTNQTDNIPKDGEDSDKSPQYNAVYLYDGGFIKKPDAERVCPLSVEVGEGYDYYIYLDSLVSDALDMSFTVKGGSTVEKDVPIGDYIIYYAAGETWYGPEHHFGPDTSYNECEEIFRFYDGGEYYNGYSLELYLQSNGNLDTEEIERSEFPG